MCENDHSKDYLDKEEREREIKKDKEVRERMVFSESQGDYLKRLTKSYYQSKTSTDNSNGVDNQNRPIFYDPTKKDKELKKKNNNNNNNNLINLPDIVWRKIISYTDDVEGIKYRFKEENDLIPYIMAISYSDVQQRERERRKGIYHLSVVNRIMIINQKYSSVCRRWRDNVSPFIDYGIVEITGASDLAHLCTLVSAKQLRIVRSLFLNFDITRLSPSSFKKAMKRLSKLSKALVVGNEKSHSLSTLVVLKMASHDTNKQYCASELIKLTQVSNFIILPFALNVPAGFIQMNDENDYTLKIKEQPTSDEVEEVDKQQQQQLSPEGLVYHSPSLTCLQLSYVDQKSFKRYIEYAYDQDTKLCTGLNNLTNFCINRIQMDRETFQMFCRLIQNSRFIKTVEISSGVISDKLPLLVDVLAEHESITRLNLCENNIQDPEPICRLVRSNKLIQHLDISNNLFNHNTDLILEELIHNRRTPLESLNLSQCGKVNTVLLGELILTNPNILQHLGLHGIQQQKPQSQQQQQQQKQRARYEYSTLDDDDDEDGSKDEHFFESLARNTTLTSIDLSYLKISAQSKPFSNFISKNTTLRRLDLTWSLQDSKDIVQHTLVNNNTLTHLNLSLNLLNAKDGEALGNVLLTNNSLVHLNLSCNQIGSGYIHIFKALQHNSTLTYLNLRRNSIRPLLQNDNNSNDHQGILFHCLNNRRHSTDNSSGGGRGGGTGPYSQCKLKYLDLSSNYLGQSAREIFLALPYNNTLNHLDLANNEIDSFSTLILYETLAMNPKTLRTINLHGNWFGCYVRELLYERYINNPNQVFSFDLSFDRYREEIPLTTNHAPFLLNWPYLKLWKIFFKLRYTNNIYS